MKTVILIITLFVLKGSCVFAQTPCSDINPNDVNAACKTLKELMDCSIKNKMDRKALIVYLTYTHINEKYSPPPAVKQYFANLSEPYIQRLSKLNISMYQNNQPPASGAPRSPMPSIVRSEN